MKEKLISALKTKYANVGLSDKAYDGVASILEKTVTEEDQIADAVASADVLVKAIQGGFDKQRNEIAELKKQLEGHQVPPEPQPAPAPTPTPSKNDEVLKALTALTARLDAMDKTKTDDARNTEALGIVEGYKFNKGRKAYVDKAWEISKAKFTDDMDANTRAETVKAEYDSLCQMGGVDGYEPKQIFGETDGSDLRIDQALKRLEASGDLPADQGN